ncbi:MAG: gephyrin-like molybdotransferase Glp [Thermacetogeniaceae bacterium]
MQVEVNLKEAQDALLGLIIPLNCEPVPLDRACGRILGLDLVATQSLPPCTQSAVDGYAIHGGDLRPGRDTPANQGLILRQVLKAGEEPEAPLAPGETVRVVTGGPVPASASAVIAEEQVRLQRGRVFLCHELAPGSNLKMTGEDFKGGEVIARPGTRLTPGLIGVLAAMGQSRVMVYRHPRVAIVSFGRELAPARETPAPGQTRDCNGPLLAALVARDGGEVAGVEILGDDDPEEDRERLVRLHSQSDLLLTIGGMAHEAGDRALPILRQLGTGMLFWGVRIKPGSHSGAGMCSGKPVIALSGNPAACSVGYEVLAVPVLRAFQGLSPSPRRLTAVCANSFPRGGGPRRFLRGYAVCGQDGWRVLVLPGQKSSMLRSLIDCNALIDLPAGHPPVEAGSEVSLILLGLY